MKIDHSEYAPLVVRMVRGDKEAFELLYVLVTPVLQGKLRKRITDSGHLEEVIQAAWVRVWEKRHTIVDPRTFIGWVVRIAVNHHISFRRLACQRDLSLIPGAYYRDDVDNRQPIDSLCRNETANSVRIALAGGNRQAVDLLHMIYADGMAYSDIAARLGIPNGTVKSRVNRARNHLCSLLLHCVDDTVTA